ncbi:hypothetical protein EMGBD3_14690 [Nitrosarchaeum sp.]|nr:hypothetical protein EMGBD3_14690 [Nitrosarchaeum sp.]
MILPNVENVKVSLCPKQFLGKSPIPNALKIAIAENAGS